LVGGAVLQVLNLAFNPLGEAGGQALAAMLEKNTTLRVLELGNTDLGIKSLVRLASALASHNRTLQYLSVESPLLNTVRSITRTVSPRSVLTAAWPTVWRQWLRSSLASFGCRGYQIKRPTARAEGIWRERR
jgi:hypothetical protein